MVSWTPSPIERLAASTKAPKITPRVVRIVRSFCCQSAATGRIRRSVNRNEGHSGLGLNLFGREHLAIPEPDHSVGATGGEFLVVRDQDER